MPYSRLIFHPQDPEQFVDSTTLTTGLIDIGFIEEEAYQNNHYLAGDRFLNLLTFLGCSPNITLTPANGESHCHIAILESSEASRCVGFTRTANPKCPHCTRRINNWKIENWENGNTDCLCDKCQTSTPYANLNWKHECGFARGGFVISQIYPHEAVPTEQLLSALENTTAYPWLYSYANNP